MHLPFNFVQTLWILTFAAHLVLLVVLLGRDTYRRFPWFTVSIAVTTVRLISSRLLYGRLPQIPMAEIFIGMADVSALLALIVVAEMARRNFPGVRPSRWILAGVTTVAIAVIGLAALGPWPEWKSIHFDTLIARLNVLQFGAEKISLFADFLTLQLGIHAVIFGRRFGIGWRNASRFLLVGLAVASLAQIAIQVAVHIMVNANTAGKNIDIDSIFPWLLNGNNGLYVAVMVAWIACLWLFEAPPAPATPNPETAPESPTES